MPETVPCGKRGYLPLGLGPGFAVDLGVKKKLVGTGWKVSLRKDEEELMRVLEVEPEHACDLHRSADVRAHVDQPHRNRAFRRESLEKSGTWTHSDAARLAAQPDVVSEQGPLSRWDIVERRISEWEDLSVKEESGPRTIDSWPSV